MHPTLLCDLGRNSFIFVARASLSFILMSWQVWLSLCWDGQLSHTRLHKIAETQLFPQLLSFGIYAGALLTYSIVAHQHHNPIPNVETENSLLANSPTTSTKKEDYRLSHTAAPSITGPVSKLRRLSVPGSGRHFPYSSHPVTPKRGRQNL